MIHMILHKWTWQVISLLYIPTWKFIYIIICSGWSLAWIFMKERVKQSCWPIQYPGLSFNYNLRPLTEIMWLGCSKEPSHCSCIRSEKRGEVRKENFNYTLLSRLLCLWSCNFHDYLMHSLQPLLLEASSPRWA